MDDFFANRIDTYDTYILENVPGCQEGYRLMAQALPADAKTLLDLGCGTGLELKEIFALHPDAQVTGIDLSSVMLQRLREKYPDSALTLIHGSYFEHSLGQDAFDAAVSFETMHHFTPEAKLGLYRRIHDALRPSGIYVECDYMVESDEEEAYFAAENRRIRLEQGIAPDAVYHYDTPLTVAHQVELLLSASFVTVRKVWREQNTTLLIAKKP